MTYYQKNSMRSIIIALLASSLALSACATKPERRGPPPDRQDAGPNKTSGTFMQPIAVLFTEMDTNKDKIVSISEVQSGTQSEWALFGRNPSAVHFAQWSIENLGSTDALPTFMSFDRDFSGSISQNEFSDELEEEFHRLDKNRDGQLERSEMIVAFAAPQGKREQKSKQGKRPERGQGGGRPPR